MNSNDTTTPETTSTSAVYDDPTVYDSSDTAEFRAKLQEVSDDDSLSMSEKEEKMDELVADELEEVDAAFGPQTGVTSAPDAVPGDVTGDPLSASYGTATAPAEEPVTLNSGDTTGDATGDVTGDPLSASYGTSSAPVEEPVTATDSYSAQAPIVDLNDTVGVAGEVELEAVYSKVDGISTITQYDDDGNIVLVQQDTDDNYSYESTAEQANGMTKVSVDLDGDYHDDQVTYLDNATGQILQQDILVDGHVTQTMVDTNSDGHPDVALIDTTGDGYLDTVEADTDGDQITNTVMVDVDGDGMFDEGAADLDNNISLETTVTSADVELGSMADLQALLPSTQYDAPTEPEPAYEPEASIASCDSYDQV
ncbi:hypothetical protein [Rhodococcus sp. H29-C3]|uniref:hypothetical protein n=1 Tax=Rhodococcus sp. H29-C3 TaxID=3046307 RepID=UPI0024BBBE7F|nr:hypothetical protein [Rhodococcus sp. H29-C3]MDJ0362250.1 hypothetical protein [Rhodococcus sp. H29-C3]